MRQTPSRPAEVFDRLEQILDLTNVFEVSDELCSSTWLYQVSETIKLVLNSDGLCDQFDANCAGPRPDYSMTGETTSTVLAGK